MMCSKCVVEDGKSGIKKVSAKFEELIPDEYHHHIASTVTHHDAKASRKITLSLHHFGCSLSLEAKCKEGHVFCCNGKMRSGERGQQKRKHKLSSYNLNTNMILAVIFMGVWWQRHWKYPYLFEHNPH
eukprot:15347815-Ditylum_brightwellii.AAC.1